MDRDRSVTTLPPPGSGGVGLVTIKEIEFKDPMAILQEALNEVQFDVSEEVRPTPDDSEPCEVITGRRTVTFALPHSSTSSEVSACSNVAVVTAAETAVLLASTPKGAKVP